MTGRLRALDGLRGLLALYILFAHTTPFLRLPASADSAAWFLSHGRGAVEMFFVLSGMVIMRSLDTGVSRVRAGQFLLARAGRLLPVYAVALAAAVAALSYGNPFVALPWLAGSTAARDMAEADWPQPWLAHLAAHVTLTQGLLPAAILPFVEFTILGPAWSLSTEWQFYLVVAIILAFRRSGGRQTRRLARLRGSHGHARPCWGCWSICCRTNGSRGRAFLPREAWYFALGTTSHGLLTSGGRSSAWRWWALSLAVATFLEWQQTASMASAVPLLWTVCLVCEVPDTPLPFRPLATVLRAAPLQWLGGISYPLYLIHMPLQRLLLLALAPAAGGRAILFSLLWGPAAILVPLVAAVALHHWVEVPCWRWSRARASRGARPFGLALPAAGEAPIPRLPPGL